ncbi:4-(cytidine 5'-diphospho)-2-C-methyl-D-erythritol kinase [Alginatibacterium sediminis]|uniref:4-diphosphocytidyl-2-C-methyl-D-erythritol kinase n=1 Tax=Alginatibacterium sediminis TaxID=2164068 RepID=A0A420E6P3_9ALTE|nr:4-(cytidine 5'-diphospho)-2-C-methyl-D-erythritol kinase [Alginatibacterium sediminis]RKF13637.1 4-(cytidine 5'-diphospho)-2-C-methyl-D-erythritol kinase [Alginatibacterium sediminis]
MTTNLNDIEWIAPAKLNLFLYINGQRSDGYHELQTLFQFLEFGDRLRFEARKDDKIIVEPAIEGVANSDNLCVKAARLLQRKLGLNQGVTIHLDKQLPMGGGLGGGSSNAATCLVVLNRLWRGNLSLDELAKLGLSLGADIPIFVHGFAAFAQGVGDKLEKVKLKTPWYLVVAPKVHVATAAVFGAKDLKRDTPKRSWEKLKSSTWGNDCEEFVLKTHPEVAQALYWLLEYAPSRMTGTGACVFAEFKDQASALQVMEKLPATWTSFVAKASNISPLHHQLTLSLS